MKFWGSRHFNTITVTLALFIIIFLLFEFNGEAKRIAEREMFSSLNEILGNAIYILNTEIEQFQDIVKNESRAISLLGYASDEALLRELSNFPKPKSMLRAHIFTNEGKLYASNENSPRQYSPIPYRSYLNNYIGGVSSPRHSEIFNKRIIYIAAPLFINEKHAGLFVGLYDLKHLDKLLLNNFLKGDCSIYIATASGDVISGSSRDSVSYDFNGEIFNRKAGNIEFLCSHPKNISENLKNGGEGYFKYLKDGEVRYVSYAPAGINDWYIAAVSTGKTLSEQLSNIINFAFDLTTGVSFIIAGILALFVLNKMKEYRAKQELLKHLAHTDMLTKLYNKFFCEQMINEELKASATGDKHAFLMIDIDHFKHINDYLGHAKGDEILCEFGAFLGDLFAQGGIAGRIGGDEFCVLVKNYGSTHKLALVSQKICAKLRQTHSADRGEHKEASTSASIGIALFPQDGTTFDELYRNADEALYRSKNTGKDRYSFFSKSKLFE